MGIAIIILALAVIYLYCRITYIRNNQNKIILKGFEDFTNGYIKQKSKNTEDFERLIVEHEIRSIAGKEDKLISLVREAKEKGYFDNAFQPFNHNNERQFSGSKIYIEETIMGTCLFVSSKACFPIFTQPYRVYISDISCIYQNGVWCKLNNKDNTDSSVSNNELQQLSRYTTERLLTEIENRQIGASVK